MFFWDEICDDREWFEPHQRGEKARAEFINSIRQEKTVRIKGPRANTKVWGSAMTTMRYGDKQIGVRKFVFANVCLAEGWSSELSDLFDIRSPSSAGFVGAPADLTVAKAAAAPPAVVAKGKGRGKAKPKVAEASVAAIKKAEQQNANNVYNGCQNMLHAVTKLLCMRPELKANKRMVMSVFGGIHDEHIKCMSGLTDEESILEYYRAEASWGWMGPLREAVASLRDLAALRRIGFATDFSAAALEAATEANMLHDDALAQSQLRLVGCLLRERGSSQARCTETYPWVLANLTSPVLAVRLAALAKFHADWDAYVEGRRLTFTEMGGNTRRSSLNTRFMEDTARIARAEGWKDSPRLNERMRKVFAGFGQERIVEQALGQCRDNALRANASHEMKGVERLSNAREDGVVEKLSNVLKLFRRMT